MTDAHAETTSPSTPHGLQRAGGLLFWSLVFGIAYTQAPLYYSNQNQYFLHGLAEAGAGYLQEDWLCNTHDPTPLFSALVAFTYRYLSESLFYVFYLVILGYYLHALVGVFDVLGGDRASPLARLLFLTLLVAVHAGLTRLGSTRLFGVDYPWYFQAGVAGQYVLGFGLQPSVFGVFLIVSMVSYVRGQPWRAIAWCCFAGIMHGTYLLGAAMLVFAYLLLECRQGRFRAAILQGLLALVLVLPMVIHHALLFAPSSAEDFAEAQRILVHFRIPHHAVVERWFDGIVLGQVGWILLSLVLIRGTPLSAILLITFLLSFLLTLLQLWTGNDSLALLFPWRTSSILVPLATAILLAKVALALTPWLSKASPGLLRSACAAVLASLVLGGVCIQVFRWGYATNDNELPMLQFVEKQRRRGEVYLIPVSHPTKVSRGAVSTNFAPPPTADQAAHLIAMDLQRFRLSTGVPIYVDFKAIPYKDVEVLEWRRRLAWAEERYRAADWSQEEVQQQLAQRGITHFVIRSDHELAGGAARRIYHDKVYSIYRVERVPAKK